MSCHGNLKGSSCQCHYCKCERGFLYCQHHKAYSYTPGQYISRQRPD